MTDYSVKYTDKTKPPITIPEGVVDSSLDIVLFGRVDLEYGQQLNQDMLNILERFACPQNAASTLSNTYPDYTINGNALTQPTQGQLWFNSTTQKLFVWNGTKWETIRNKGDVAGNWGQLLDGSQIPRPVNPVNGYVYPYSQCIWAVSPAALPQAFTYMECTTDTNAVVSMKYRAYGDSVLSSGIANYLIIAIAGNINMGTISVTPEIPSVSGTPTPTPPTSVTPLVSITPSPTPTSTPGTSAVPSPTPAASTSSTPAASLTATPTPTLTPASTLTPTPSPFVDACSRCIADGFHCCVAVNSFLPDGSIAGHVQVGTSMSLADPVTLEPSTGIVSYSEPSLQESVRVVTQSGASLNCSLTAPLPTTEGLLLAPDVLGKFVAIMMNDIASWDEVISVEPIGKIWVQHITVGDNCFWAGDSSNAFILHHNIKCCYCDGQTDCSWVPPNCCDGTDCS
jgi:hypothetical protein